MPTDFYVQVRYPHHAAWVAVDAAESRRDAARLAAAAFRHRIDAAGKTPTQVRIIKSTTIVAEGGQDALDRVTAEIRLRNHLPPPT